MILITENTIKKNSLINTHFISSLFLIASLLILNIIFDKELYVWQSVTIYTGFYSFFIPLRYLFCRPSSILLFLFFLNTLRYSSILTFNKELSLSIQFNSLSYLIFIAVLIISILDIFLKDINLDYYYFKKNNLYILISFVLIIILPFLSILIPNGQEQFFLLSNFFLFTNIAIPNKDQSISKMILNFSLYIILYLITLLIFYSLKDDFPLNRTSFLIPLYLSSIVLIKNIVYKTKLFNFSLFRLNLLIFKLIKNKKILLYSVIFISITSIIFVYSLSRKILSSGVLFDDLNDILIFVIRFQINELIDPDIIQTFSERLSEVSNSFISQQLTFRSFLWIFSFLIPSFIFPNRQVLNVSKYLEENVGFWYQNYFEPFFNFFIEGSSLLFFFYVIFLPLVLVFIILKLARNNSFSVLSYYLYFAIYSYYSISFGFTRYMLAPFFGSLILFFSKRLRI